jgi:6-phosphogluconolactonase
MTTDEPLRPVPRVEIHPDADTLAATVAGALLGRVAEAQEAGGDVHVALTGGTIAELVHREIARHHSGAVPDVRPVDWSRVHVWWGDERFVPADSPDRNARQAREAFLDAVGASRVHEVPASDQVADAEEAAASYSRAVREDGSGEFDVVMLGLGPDGHIASLFPGHPGLEARDAIAIAVHDSPKPPPDRVSLTFEALNRARAVWFLVSGDGKAEAVARALADVPDGASGSAAASVRETPARGVLGREETIWFLDSPAASHL